MGFGDKLKDLRDQAQQTVAENKDKIQGAVQSAGEVANAKTHGKYADKISKIGEKVSAGVEKFGADADDSAAHPEPPAASAPADPTVPQEPEPGAGSTPPEFDE
jgi:hypothetical protein